MSFLNDSVYIGYITKIGPKELRAAMVRGNWNVESTEENKRNNS